MTQKGAVKTGPNSPQIRLLVIDDNANFLETLVRFIARDPQLTVVGAAGNARDGLALAKLHQPDIVLVDLQMPEVSGLEAIPLLRARVPTACIVAMTLYDEKMFEQAALKQGAHAFIEKDRMVQELNALVHKLAGTGCAPNSQGEKR